MLREEVCLQGLIISIMAIFFVAFLVQGKVLESITSVNAREQSCYRIDPCGGKGRIKI